MDETATTAEAPASWDAEGEAATVRLLAAFDADDSRATWEALRDVVFAAIALSEEALYAEEPADEGMTT